MDRKLIARQLVSLAKELLATEDVVIAAFSPEKEQEIISRLPSMSISEIARVIHFDWKNPEYSAKPYLDAMGDLETVNDSYMADSGRSIVLYFLSNSGKYRGDLAKAIKKELTKRCK